MLISKSIYKAFVYFGKKVQVDVYKSNGNYSADDSKYISPEKYKKQTQFNRNLSKQFNQKWR